jgi:MtN3 and saliva related transmembrane protein
MGTIELLAVLAGTVGVVMASSPLFQIRRILERRSSADLSIATMSVLFVGSAIWFAYGSALGNLAIMLPNGVGLVVWVATIAVTLRFRSRAA